MNMDDLQETARLAHLNLNDAELAGAYPAFEQMLGFFAVMRAADQDRSAMPAVFSGEDSASLSPSSARTVPSSRFRHDKNGNNARHTASNGLNPQTPEYSGASTQGDLLDNAGERDGRFIVVPNVL